MIQSVSFSRSNHKSINGIAVDIDSRSCLDLVPFLWNSADISVFLLYNGMLALIVNEGATRFGAALASEEASTSILCVISLLTAGKASCEEKHGGYKEADSSCPSETEGIAADVGRHVIVFEDIASFDKFNPMTVSNELMISGKEWPYVIRMVANRVQKNATMVIMHEIAEQIRVQDNRPVRTATTAKVRPIR
jgi:hypothetical protein